LNGKNAEKRQLQEQNHNCRRKKETIAGAKSEKETIAGARLTVVLGLATKEVH